MSRCCIDKNKEVNEGGLEKWMTKARLLIDRFHKYVLFGYRDGGMRVPTVFEKRFLQALPD